MSIRIACLVDGVNEKPWFLVETYTTTDGMRTRVCDGHWATREQAQAAADVRLRIKDTLFRSPSK